MAFIGATPTPVPLTATDIPDLPATKITSGTFPALNGSNLTNLDASDLTGTLPAISGANLTGIQAKLVQYASSANDSTTDYTGTSGTKYVIQKSSADWETTLTGVQQGNKVLIIFHLNISKDSEDSSPRYYLEGKIDSGSYTDIDVGTSSGSRTPAFGFARPYATDYGMVVTSGSKVWSPSISGSTGTVKVRFQVQNYASGNRRIYHNYTHNNNAESGSYVANCVLMELDA